MLIKNQMETTGKIIRKYPITNSNGNQYQNFFFELENGSVVQICAFGKINIDALYLIELNKKIKINVVEKEGRYYFSGLKINKKEPTPILQQISLQKELMDYEQTKWNDYIEYRWNNDLQNKVIHPSMDINKYKSMLRKALYQNKHQLIDTLFPYLRGCEFQTIEDLISVLKIKKEENPDLIPFPVGEAGRIIINQNIIQYKNKTENETIHK